MVPEPAGTIPSALTMAVGERLELELPGLGTAGYRWTAVLAGDTGAVSTRWRRGEPGNGQVPRRAGASAPERLEITAAAPGHVTVHLAQARPWQTGPARREHEILIEVRSR